MATHMMSRLAGVQGSYNWFSWSQGASSGDIDIDADGEMPDTEAVCDLSQALSLRLGKQMSMMSVYKVNYIGIRLVNVDDVTDNTLGAHFGGKVQYWEPSKHRIDAMQAARAVERHAESGEIDADSFLLTTEKDYSGMRFDWDAGGQVAYATSENFAALVGTEWDLKELFQIYSDMLDNENQKANSLWSRRTGIESNMGWTASIQNHMATNIGVPDEYTYNPRSDMWEIYFPEPIEVLGGLLNVQVNDSSTESLQIQDDDYNLEITVGVTGWSDF